MRLLAASHRSLRWAHKRTARQVTQASGLWERKDVTLEIGFLAAFEQFRRTFSRSLIYTNSCLGSRGGDGLLF